MIDAVTVENSLFIITALVPCILFMGWYFSTSAGTIYLPLIACVLWHLIVSCPGTYTIQASCIETLVGGGPPNYGERIKNDWDNTTQEPLAISCSLLLRHYCFLLHLHAHLQR